MVFATPAEVQVMHLLGRCCGAATGCTDSLLVGFRPNGQFQESGMVTARGAWLACGIHGILCMMRSRVLGV